MNHTNIPKDDQPWFKYLYCTTQSWTNNQRLSYKNLILNLLPALLPSLALFFCCYIRKHWLRIWAGVTGWSCTCLLTFSNSMTWRPWVMDFIRFRSAATPVLLRPVGDQRGPTAPLYRDAPKLIVLSAAEHPAQVVIKHRNATPIPGYICLIMMVGISYLSSKSQPIAASSLQQSREEGIKQGEGGFTEPTTPHLIQSTAPTTLTSIWSM